MTTVRGSSTASPAMRLMFNAKHTRCHSPRTLCAPRTLNRRNPGTRVKWLFDVRRAREEFARVHPTPLSNELAHAA